MLATRLAENRENECASGISENVTEATKLLDGFLTEIREAKLERKRVHD